MNLSTIFFTFTFTILSSTFLNMLTALHRGMNKNMYDTNEVIYRKRSEPCRIVSFDLLIQTNDTNDSLKSQNNGILVNDDGILSSDDTWHPLRKTILPVAINKSSWNGLVKRFNESKENSVRA